MTDISKCENKECPSRLKCYRYTAPANKYRQSYMEYKVPKNRKKCDSFWKREK